MKFARQAFFSVIFFGIFLAVYLFFGAPFLVTWGEKTLFKKIYIFIVSVPIDWFEKFDSIFIALIGPILFWMLLVYLILIAIGRLIRKL